MEDREIVDLFFARDERAVSEVGKKYGSIISHVIGKYLDDKSDVEECVNDTYLEIWKRIPPNRPEHLNAFAVRIAKAVAINRLKSQGRQKRGGGCVMLALDELEEVCDGSKGPEDEYVMNELTGAIEHFLRAQEAIDRKIFVRRYWFIDSSAQIGRMYGLSTMNVNVRLHRLRKRLREYLIAEGYLEN